MTYILNGREVDLGLDNVRNKEAKLTYLTFVWEIHWFVCGYYYDFLRIYTLI